MIPNKVKIAGIEYSVTEKHGLEQKHGLLGHVLYSLSEIEIDDRLNQDRKEQVLVHELLHACFHEAGFEEQDEEMINRISIVLYQVLKENHLAFGETVTTVGTDCSQKITMKY
ncbi:ImmA/IrrE family metallo-endopeptidase [Bacillus timonensis]|uniref:ImmA/IrrE family metallo-endopeptidase n=1 Tax=Bacillus timonensis TaxID=1033734 RepID=A0A4S3PLB5_9BACI|nr:ImmA/IrrE family metallo-endopeptidase [Bacillus timonensis]THE09934.1 ImmA/IrrE family metallo-endopeptidase [Bacillus timonensis]